MMKVVCVCVCVCVILECVSMIGVTNCEKTHVPVYSMSFKGMCMRERETCVVETVCAYVI